MAQAHSQRHATGRRGLWFAWLLAACEPKVVVGNWSCPDAAGEDGSGNTSELTAPWSTGFEDGFCGYTRASGHCYSDDAGTYEAVSSPVHSGSRAAVFAITTATSNAQARCFLEGVLPEEAYYGAWYFIPAPASSPNNWNLIHFQGGEGGPLHGLWDVTITAATDGSLRLSVYDFLGKTFHHAEGVGAVPIGSWFHIQFFLRRASSATGAFTLYQDGRIAAEAEGIVTDDSSYGQWYVGNLALSLSPSESTVYVDDVSMTSEL